MHTDLPLLLTRAETLDLLRASVRVSHNSLDKLRWDMATLGDNVPIGRIGAIRFPRRNWRYRRTDILRIVGQH